MFNRSWGKSQQYNSGYSSNYDSNYGSSYSYNSGSKRRQLRMMRKNAKEQERQLDYQMKLQTRSEVNRIRREAKQRKILQRETEKYQDKTIEGTVQSQNTNKKFNIKSIGSSASKFMDKVINGDSKKEILKVSKLEYDDTVIEDVGQYRFAKCGVLSND